MLNLQLKKNGLKMAKAQICVLARNEKIRFKDLVNMQSMLYNLSE